MDVFVVLLVGGLVWMIVGGFVIGGGLENEMRRREKKDTYAGINTSDYSPPPQDSAYAHAHAENANENDSCGWAVGYVGVDGDPAVTRE